MNFLKLKNDFLGKIYVKQKDVYFRYSNDEQWTGRYWVDGKKIYNKVIVCNASNQFDFYIPLDISDYKQIVHIEIIGSYANSNTFFPIPSVAPSTGNYIYNWAITNGNLRIFSTINITGDIAVIVEYTKNND